MAMMLKIRTFIHCWWESKWYNYIGKNSLAVPQNVKKELSYDLTSPFLSIYPREMKTNIDTKACTVLFTVALFIMVKEQKQLKVQAANRKAKWGISNGKLFGT